MNLVLHHLRTRRTGIAWLLLALILFNGLLCSLGHGLMSRASTGHGHGAASQVMAEEGCADHHEMSSMGEHHAQVPMSMSGASDHASGTSGMMPQDCAFAATLTMALIFFVALGWLQRSRPARCILRALWHSVPARHCSSGLNPHAP